LGGNVFRGQIAPALTSAAAFQKIVSQEADMPANMFGINGLESNECGPRQLHRRSFGRASGGSLCPGWQAQTHDQKRRDNSRHSLHLGFSPDQVAFVLKNAFYDDLQRL
jgi:hypothetical protein